MLLAAQRFVSQGDHVVPCRIYGRLGASAGHRRAASGLRWALAFGVLLSLSGPLTACEDLVDYDASAPGWSDPEVPDVPWADDAPEVVGTLRFVNHPWTTVWTLHDGAGIDEAAARALLARRAGPDGISGSLDDRPFRHADELAAQPGVGREGVRRLAAYAVARGWVPRDADAPFDPWLGLFDGVQLTLSEADAVLLVANTASAVELDEDAALYASAVTEILGRRPFQSPAELAACPGVGAGNLLRLKRYAMAHADVGSLVGQGE